MKRILLLVLFIVGFFSCNEEKNDSDFQYQYKKVLYTFQPSLNINSQVVIDFETKDLYFLKAYDYVEEPPLIGEMKISDKTKTSIKEFHHKLSNEELKDLEKILKTYQDKDFKTIDDISFDGMHTTFSIINTKDEIKTGFTNKNNKTVAQSVLFDKILDLLTKYDVIKENSNLISYYQMMK
ncbi:hypothetical protein HXZ62_11795 [Empedobacter falsenii]|uniref:hypothetical protein n=1 Tax=Empedobacter falsenii TaxID=343874 RepID=UPI002578B65C|nr:hypothetical protein [Empedobacter falsenii]MDM1063232.1 hypothetical protein [Empedobacter falsenii]